MAESSSSGGESDRVERSRNVHNLLVRSVESQQDLDENYAYKQKLGDLRFDANFEGGNLGGVTQVNRYEYDLQVRPDVSNPRLSLWFNFVVSNQRPNQCVILNVINLSERITMFNEPILTPVARSRHEPNWVRLRSDQVFYYRTRDNHKFRLSIAFRFSLHDNDHQFALFYPYTLTTLDNFITRWSVHLRRCRESSLQLSSANVVARREVADQLRHDHSTTPGLSRGRRKIKYERNRTRSCTPTGQLQRRSPTPSRAPVDVSSRLPVANLTVKILTTSVLSKPIYELNIGNLHRANSHRTTIIIVGRSIGNFESICSLVCQAILDFMLSDDPLASMARDILDIVAFPMLDPDSIWVGNSRTDLFGQRIIDSSTIKTNPSLYQNYRLARERVQQICTDSQSTPAKHCTVIELRVSQDLIGSRVKGTLYADSIRMERHLQFPKLLSRFADGFYLEKCVFTSNSSRGGSLKDSSFSDVTRRFTHVEHYWLEISPFGYHKRSLVDQLYVEYDQLKYLLLGKSICYALIVSTRNKDKDLLGFATEHLKSFQPTQQDIDDLTLF